MIPMRELESGRNSSWIFNGSMTIDSVTGLILPINRRHSRTPSAAQSAEPTDITVPESDPPPYEEVAQGETITALQSSSPPAYEAVLSGQFPELQTGSNHNGNNQIGSSQNTNSDQA